MLCQECKDTERINIQFLTWVTFLEAHFRDNNCEVHSFIIEPWKAWTVFSNFHFLLSILEVEVDWHPNSVLISYFWMINSKLSSVKQKVFITCRFATQLREVYLRQQVCLGKSALCCHLAEVALGIGRIAGACFPHGDGWNTRILIEEQG